VKKTALIGRMQQTKEKVEGGSQPKQKYSMKFNTNNSDGRRRESYQNSSCGKLCQIGGG